MAIGSSQVRVSGPLSAFAAGFADELANQGYRPGPARKQMWLLAHLSRWLGGEGLGAADLHASEVERFLRSRRAADYRYPLSIKAMQPTLAFLRGLGVAPMPPLSTPSGPVEAALERYRRYLTVERGLGTGNRARLCRCRTSLSSRQALARWPRPGPGHLTAADVVSFVVRRCPHQGRARQR